MYSTTTIREKYQLLFKILLPILLYQLANYSAQFVDAVMTGQYSEVHLAGVSIAGNIWSPFFTFLNGIVSALIPIVGHFYGKGQLEKVSSSVRQFLYIAILLSFVLMIGGVFFIRPILNIMQLESTVDQVALGYLTCLSIGIVPLFLFSVLRSFIDALGFTRISMMLMILVIPFNSCFNYMMIYGKFGLPEMGGVGAGLGTAAAYWLLLLIVIAVVHYHPKLKEYRVLQFEKPDVQQWKEGFRLGVPIGLTVFAEVAVFAFVGLLMSSYSSSIIAAHQAAMNFSMISYAFPMSMSSALTIIIAYELGRNDAHSVKQFTWIGISTSVCIACCTLLTIYLNLHQVASLYGTNPEFVALTMQFMTYSLFFQLLDAVAAPTMGILRGYKDANIPFAIGLVSYWLLGMPLAVVLNHTTNLGAFSYWIGLIVGLLMNGVLLFGRLKIMMNKYFAKKNSNLS